MKKFYFLLVALMVGLAANAATVYFENTSNWARVYMYAWTGGSNNGWPGTQLTETVEKDGHTYYVATTSYESCIFNNGSGVQTSDLGVNDDGIYNASGFTGESFSGGELEVSHEIYIVGANFGSWGKTEANKFETTDNVVFTKSYSEVKGEFKFMDGGIWIGGPASIDLNTTVILGASTNMKLADQNATDITLTYNVNENSLTVTGTPGEGGEDPEPPVTDFTSWYVNIVGDFNSWTDNGLNPDTEGLTTHNNLAIGTQGFKVKIWNGSADTYYVTDGSAIVPGEWTQMYEDLYDGAASQIQDATADAVYNVEYNCATNQVKVTLVEGEEPNPAEGYLEATYDFAAIADTYTDEADWAADGTTSNTYVNCTDKVLDSNGFSLVTTKGTSTDARLYKTSTGKIDYRVYKGSTLTVTAPSDYYLTKVEFYAADANSTSQLNSLPDVDNWTKTSITDLPDGMKLGCEYAGSATAQSSTLALSLTKNMRISKIQAYATAIWLGVEQVKVANDEDAPIEYYNLQGVRVDNPAAGLYIRRQGNTVTKVLVK